MRVFQRAHSNGVVGRSLRETTTWPHACLMLTGGILIGQYNFWGYGLAGGFGNFIIAMFVCSLMYYCLANTLSEMSSILPFAGGTYGYVRVTMGVYVGYIIGCCELYSYLVLNSLTLVLLGNIMTSTFGVPVLLEPMWWVVFSLLAVIPILRNVNLWLINTIISVFAIVPILLYVVMAPFVTYASVPRHAQSDSYAFFEGSVSGFFIALGPASLLYLGLEIFPLMSEDIKKPKVSIPKATMSCTYTVIIISYGVVIVACATTPIDDLVISPFTLQQGFAAIVGVKHNMSYLMIAPAYLMMSGFCFAYSRLIFAMARSGLFSRALGELGPFGGAPRNALLTGTAASLLLCVVAWFSPEYQDVYSGGILAAVCAYFSSFVSFIIFRLHFTELTVKRNYKSQTGTPGALFGIAMSIAIFISSAINNPFACLIFLLMMTLFSLYYYLVASSRQRLSIEEKEVMMIAHIIKDHRKKLALQIDVQRKQELERMRVIEESGGLKPLPLPCNLNSAATKRRHMLKKYPILPEITLRPLKMQITGSIKSSINPENDPV